MKLKAPKGRVIVSVDVELKNSHTFESGVKLYIGRKYNNLNRRETEPVNATVIDAENIPEGSQILVHHNSFHDAYMINNYRKLGGAADDIREFSIEEDRCYLWREKKGDEWKPLKGYATALRVYKPYKGFLTGIDPTEIKNVLFITSGELCGKVANQLIATDYEIIYQGDDNREARIIRCRHYEGAELNDREEIVAIDNDLTRRVHAGELLVGISPTKAAIHNEYAIYG
jgi:hypothetical protein